MNLKQAIPAFAVSLLLAGGAVADDQGKRKNKHHQKQQQQSEQSRTTGFGVGTAEADRRGASAGAIIGGQIETQRRGGDGSSMATPPAGTATTFGTGAVSVQRNNVNAAGSTGANATGPGTNTATSDLYVTGEVDKSGAFGDVGANSTAQSTEPRRQRRPR